MCVTSKIEQIEKVTDKLILDNNYIASLLEVVIGKEIYLKYKKKRVGYFYQENGKMLFKYTI